MDSDAPPLGSHDQKMIYDVDCESLFGPPKTTLNFEIQRPQPSLESPNISGQLPLIHPFDFDVYPS